MIRILSFALALFILAIPSVQADVINADYIKLTELNRLKPLQNPEFETIEEVLGLNILDRRSHVIGKVKDLLVLKSNGSLQNIGVELNDIRLNTMIFMNRDVIRGTKTSGYEIALEEEEVEDLFPALLAQTEPAGASNTVSIQTLQGARITASNNRILGTVKNVLLNDTRTKADAVYVSMKYGNMRGKEFAIPFSNLDYNNLSQSNRSVSVSDSFADTMIKYAKQN